MSYFLHKLQLHVSALENGHYQAPKHVAVPYVENTLHSTNKYSCVRPVHTHYSSYFIEHNGDDEPHGYDHYFGCEVGDEDKHRASQCLLSNVCEASDRMVKWFAPTAVLRPTHGLEGNKRPLILFLLSFKQHDKYHLQIQTNSEVDYTPYAVRHNYSLELLKMGI